MIISDEIAREGTFSLEDCPFLGEGRQLAASDKLSVLPQVKLVFLLLLKMLSWKNSKKKKEIKANIWERVKSIEQERLIKIRLILSSPSESGCAMQNCII